MYLELAEPISGGYSSAVATFGDNLKRERERRRITQIQFAEMLGVKQAQISSWEKGRRLPEPPSIQRIAAALSREGSPCSPADLLAGVVTEYDVLRGAVAPTAERQATALMLSMIERRALRLLGLTSDVGQRQAVGLLAEVAKAFPRPQPQPREPAVRSDRTSVLVARKVRGTR